MGKTFELEQLQYFVDGRVPCELKRDAKNFGVGSAENGV